MEWHSHSRTKAVRGHWSDASKEHQGQGKAWGVSESERNPKWGRFLKAWVK